MYFSIQVLHIGLPVFFRGFAILFYRPKRPNKKSRDGSFHVNLWYSNQILKLGLTSLASLCVLVIFLQPYIRSNMFLKNYKFIVIKTRIKRHFAIRKSIFHDSRECECFEWGFKVPATLLLRYRVFRRK